MISVHSEVECLRTREYAERLQDTLLGMRHTHTPSQYEWMRRSLVKELAKAQQQIAMYLAAPPDDTDENSQTQSDSGASRPEE